MFVEYFVTKLQPALNPIKNGNSLSATKYRLCAVPFMMLIGSFSINDGNGSDNAIN